MHRVNGGGDKDCGESAIITAAINNFEKVILPMRMNIEDDFYVALELSDKEYHELFDIFVQELAVFNEHINKRGDQIWRRTYTRTLFSMIDALTYRLKEDVYSLLESEGAEVTSEYERNLRGKIIKRNKDGQVKIKHFYQSLPNSVEYAFSNYALMHCVDYKLDKTNSGWKCFINSLKIRNRITHPKEAADLVIDNDELITIQSAGKWYVDTMADICMKCANSLFDLADALKRNWKIQHPNE